MLIFEKSRPGRGCDLLPECDVEVTLPQEKDKRKKKLHLPEQTLYRTCKEITWCERWFLSTRILYHEIQSEDQ